MKIVLLSHSDSTGGAAIAAYRLFKALESAGHHVKMVVQEKKTDDPNVIRTGTTAGFWFRFALDRLRFVRREASKKVRFRVSLASTGVNIMKNKYVREADIVHLHWINNGFVSLKGLDRLMASGKRIVWTMHDMWAFTGGCHYCSGICDNYETHCGKCPFLRGYRLHDMSYRIFKKKQHSYTKAASLSFVGCSQWLSTAARQSALAGKRPVSTIPNPIDTDFFHPQEAAPARTSLGLDPGKTYILFGAYNLNDERKGAVRLIEAMKTAVRERSIDPGKTGVILFGHMENDLTELFPAEVKYVGYVRDREALRTLYAACTFFALPSLEDNLPNTVMEALCCGRPVLAFSIGGIPDMVRHRFNGFLAECGNNRHLAEGIGWLMENTGEEMNRSCRTFAEENYSPASVVGKMEKVYNGTHEE